MCVCVYARECMCMYVCVCVSECVYKCVCVCNSRSFWPQQVCDGDGPSLPLVDTCFGHVNHDTFTRFVFYTLFGCIFISISSTYVKYMCVCCVCVCVFMCGGAFVSMYVCVCMTYVRIHICTYLYSFNSCLLQMLC